MWCAYKCMQCWVQCGTKLQAVMEPAPPRRAVDKPTVHMSHNNKQTPQPPWTTGPTATEQHGNGGLQRLRRHRATD